MATATTLNGDVFVVTTAKVVELEAEIKVVAAAVAVVVLVVVVKIVLIVVVLKIVLTAAIAVAMYNLHRRTLCTKLTTAMTSDFNCEQRRFSNDCPYDRLLNLERSIRF